MSLCDSAQDGCIAFLWTNRVIAKTVETSLHEDRISRTIIRT